jgi:hypothetical protein
MFALVPEEKGRRMIRRRRRLAVGAALLLALAAAAIGGLTRSDGVPSIGARGEGELPTALGKHLDQLAKTRRKLRTIGQRRRMPKS